MSSNIEDQVMNKFSRFEFRKTLKLKTCKLQLNEMLEEPSGQVTWAISFRIVPIDKTVCVLKFKSNRIRSSDKTLSRSSHVKAFRCDARRPNRSVCIFWRDSLWTELLLNRTPFEQNSFWTLFNTQSVTLWTNTRLLGDARALRQGVAAL